MYKNLTEASQYIHSKHRCYSFGLVTDPLHKGVQCDIMPYCAHTLFIYESCEQRTILILFLCYTERNVNQCILNTVRVRVRVTVTVRVRV